MVKIGAGSSEKFFKINGLEYPVGGYEIVYQNKGIQDETKVKIGFRKECSGDVIQSPVSLPNWQRLDGSGFNSLSELLIYLDSVISFKKGSGGGSTGLEKITENGKSGWRLIGKNPDGYADIGDNAVDVSHTSTTKNKYGAKGDNSFVSGLDSIAETDNSAALGHGVIAKREGAVSVGKYNVGESDSIFEVGIGSGDAYFLRKNAVEVSYNGLVKFPSLTLSGIEDAPLSTAITKEYLESKYVYILDGTPPPSSTSKGKKGTIIYDNDSYVYLCVDTDKWVRFSVENSWGGK